MKVHYQLKYYNFRLILWLIAISIIGILAVGSANPAYQDKQILGFGVGLFMMLVLSFLDYSIFLKLYWVIYIANLLLLLAVRFLGNSAGGARRWFQVAGIRFQPSEFTKILLILFFAQFIMKYREKLNSIRILGLIAGLSVLPLFLIVSQPDLSTTIVMVVVLIIMLYLGGISWKLVLSAFLIAVPTIIILLTVVLQEDQGLLKDYQQVRILAWLNPSEYSTTEGLQQSNSIMAIGSGLLWGKGLNNNVIGSVKNGNFISAPQTDFIYAIIGEEMGFVGASAVIILLFVIAVECFLISRRAKDLAGRLIACSVGMLIATQSFLNISVATGLLPNTGIPLPFVSYGLSSLVSLYIGMGFVLNIGLQRTKPQKTTERGYNL